MNVNLPFHFLSVSYSKSLNSTHKRETHIIVNSLFNSMRNELYASKAIFQGSCIEFNEK